MGKAIWSVVKQDVVAATGPLQSAGGLDGECEAAVHAMNALFEKEETEALMFVDAENVFNNLNRQVALWNIQYICPVIAKVLINCYRSGTCLFVGGKMLTSQEVMTQGDPLAMTMFALASVQLINAVKVKTSTQVWFADDGSAGGRAGFTPLVFTTSVGMASEATVFIKRLASMLAEKRGESYSETMGFVRCAVSFCLLRAVLSCIRSSYSFVKVQLKEQSVSDAVAVSRITG